MRKSQRAQRRYGDKREAHKAATTSYGWKRNGIYVTRRLLKEKSGTELHSLIRVLISTKRAMT